MRINYLTAIGFDFTGKPYKYRNIDPDKIAKFEQFCITDKHNKPPLRYVNYYNARSKAFIERKYLLQN